jgi:hypothetical protein
MSNRNDQELMEFMNGIILHIQNPETKEIPGTFGKNREALYGTKVDVFVNSKNSY